MSDEKRIVEIGGVKMEVDLRYVREIEEYRIGDNVKVLIKSYGETFNSYAGTIIGFDNFKERPAILIAYLKYNEIEFLTFTADTKETEICPMVDNWIAVDKGSVLDQMDRKITSAEATVRDLKAQREYFLRNFGKYFSGVEE